MVLFTCYQSLNSNTLQIYKHQPDRPMVLKSTQHHSSVKFVDMVMVHLIPIPQILSSVLQSLKVHVQF